MAATTVVASAYDTSGNGGRKIVRLSNGWLICVLNDSVVWNRIFFMKSTDNGANWTQLCYVAPANSNASLCTIASSGTNVYFFGLISSIYKSVKFDATTVSNIDITSTAVTVDSGQTSFGSGVSLVIDGAGTLHATWCSKNSTYPNSFNIRYAKSTDGGTTWVKIDGTAGVNQVTTSNISGANNSNPCIVVRTNNYPIIFYDWNNGTTSNYINNYRWNGAVWTSSTVYQLNGYSQASACAAVDGNDNIHVVWRTQDSTYANYQIAYSKSTDGGATWSAKQYISTDLNRDQYPPSISINNNNKCYVLWGGYDPAISVTYMNLRLRTINSDGSFNSTTAITNSTTGTMVSPSLLWSKYNMNSSDAIRWIYQDQQAAAVKYDSIALLWSHKLMGVSTPNKIMGVQPSKVMGIQ